MLEYLFNLLFPLIFKQKIDDESQLMVAVGLGAKSCTITMRKHGQGRREATVLFMPDDPRLCFTLWIIF